MSFDAVETLDMSTPEAKRAAYALLLAQVRAVLEGERDALANLAQFAALVFHALPGLNWAGFYWMKEGELVLGPFQGKPACVRIPPGRGVCGAAVARGETLVVPDVHAFPGHIACDAASRSELVAPLWREGRIIGVLDLDCPLPNRFDEADRRGCEALAAAFTAASDPFGALPSQISP